MNASAPASMRDALARFSSAALASTAAVALTASSTIALYSPSWWRAALLAFSIGAAALSTIADRRITELRARAVAKRAPVLVPLRVLRAFAGMLAVVSGLAFVLIGAALLMGSPGAGG